MTDAALPARKRALRAEIAARVASLDSEARRRMDAAVADRAASLVAERDAGVIFAYAALPDEVETRGLLARLAEEGRTVCVPRVREGRRLAWGRLRDVARDLAPGTMGIDEPRVLDAGDLHPDLVLAPGRAFDRQGGRLGRGGGYYDRFFANRSGGELLCGLCYAVQVVFRVPRGPRDVAVDRVLTDEGEVTVL